MYQILESNSQKKAVRTIFLASLFVAFHYYFVVYINSSFLEGFISKEKVGVFYSIGSVLNIILILLIPKLLKKTGNYLGIIILSIIEILAILTLGLKFSAISILIAFIIHQSINPLIGLQLDIGIEDDTDKKNLGKARGIFLTIISIAAVLSPIIVGSLVKEYSLSLVYFISAFFMIIFLTMVVFKLKNISSGIYKKTNPIDEIKEFFRDKDTIRIGVIGLILQLFYSLMIIYAPIFLREEIGFSWKEIGAIISIALLPFILFQIPVGKISDEKSNEKQLMAIGLLIIFVSCILIPFISANDFIVWASILFFTRVGASILETSSESYFFKKIKGKDELISVYRMTSPVAFIIGPILASIILSYGKFGLLFTSIGIISFSGLLFVAKLKNISSV